MQIDAEFQLMKCAGESLDNMELTNILKVHTIDIEDNFLKSVICLKRILQTNRLSKCEINIDDCIVILNPICRWIQVYV